ncbi:MAG: hypothetical protein OQK71_08540 [Desulfobacter sp.]|nr:hypothetical protein [Desulfobacter sp.]
MSIVKHKHLLSHLCIAAIFLLAVQAFAQQGRYHQKPSPADCDAYARNTAANYSEGVLGGAVRGGVRGVLDPVPKT